MEPGLPHQLCRECRGFEVPASRADGRREDAIWSNDVKWSEEPFVRRRVRCGNRLKTVLQADMRAPRAQLIGPLVWGAVP